MGINRIRLTGFVQLESRIVPAVARTLGTFEITDTSAAPNHTWSSPYTDYDNTVPEDDNLVATQAVTYGSRSLNWQRSGATAVSKSQISFGGESRTSPTSTIPS